MSAVGRRSLEAVGLLLGSSGYSAEGEERSLGQARGEELPLTGGPLDQGAPAREKAAEPEPGPVPGAGAVLISTEPMVVAVRPGVLTTEEAAVGTASLSVVAAEMLFRPFQRLEAPLGV